MYEIAKHFLLSNYIVVVVYKPQHNVKCVYVHTVIYGCRGKKHIIAKWDR